MQAGAAGVRALLAELVEREREGRVRRGDGAKPPAVVIAIDQAEELFRPEGAAEGATLLELVRDLDQRGRPDGHRDLCDPLGFL